MSCTFNRQLLPQVSIHISLGSEMKCGGASGGGITTAVSIHISLGSEMKWIDQPPK